MQEQQSLGRDVLNADQTLALGHASKKNAYVQKGKKEREKKKRVREQSEKRQTAGRRKSVCACRGAPSESVQVNSKARSIT